MGRMITVLLVFPGLWGKTTWNAGFEIALDKWQRNSWSRGQWQCLTGDYHTHVLFWKAFKVFSKASLYFMLTVLRGEEVVNVILPFPPWRNTGQETWLVPPSLNRNPSLLILNSQDSLGFHNPTGLNPPSVSQEANRIPFRVSQVASRGLEDKGQ